VLNFEGVKYLANIGCAASMGEARELSDNIITIPVKDKAMNWEPTPEETYPIIKAGVLQALRNRESMKSVHIEAPYRFSMSLMDGFVYKIPTDISWRGSFSEKEATWEAPSIEIGLELFNYVRESIVSV
jgi:D-aminopeptidase